jgi:hypothetical protein
MARCSAKAPRPAREGAQLGGGDPQFDPAQDLHQQAGDNALPLQGRAIQLHLPAAQEEQEGSGHWE